MQSDVYQSFISIQQETFCLVCTFDYESKFQIRLEVLCKSHEFDTNLLKSKLQIIHAKSSYFDVICGNGLSAFNT